MHLLSRLSLKNRALIALVTIVASVFGVIGVGSLKQELMPSVQFPAIVVLSSYPGASPEVVNNDVSTPIETAIQGIAGLESTTATSTTNASIIQASFTYGTDLAAAEQKIQQAINRIKSTLPSGVEPNVVSFSIDDLPVIALVRWLGPPSWVGASPVEAAVHGAVWLWIAFSTFMIGRGALLWLRSHTSRWMVTGAGVDPVSG